MFCKYLIRVQVSLVPTQKDILKLYIILFKLLCYSLGILFKLDRNLYQNISFWTIISYYSLLSRLLHERRRTRSRKSQYGVVCLDVGFDYFVKLYFNPIATYLNDNRKQYSKIFRRCNCFKRN